MPWKDLLGQSNAQVMATGSMTGKNPFWNPLITILFFAQQPGEVHEQRQPGQVGSLHRHIDQRQSDPAAPIHFHTKE